MRIFTPQSLLVIGWALFSLSPATASADDLDAILDGFDDAEILKENSDLDDALEGFGGAAGGDRLGSDLQPFPEVTGKIACGHRRRRVQ